MQPQIRRAKVVPPLRRAVRFVHGKERDPGLGKRRAKFLTRESLRGGHHQERPAFGDSRHRFAPGLAAHGPIDSHHGNISLFEATGLVLKQCKQGRNDHNRLRKNHRGDLVASRLAVPRWQHYEGIAPLETVKNRAFLLGIKAFNSQPLCGLDELRLLLGADFHRHVTDRNKFGLMDLDRFDRGQSDRGAPGLALGRFPASTRAPGLAAPISPIPTSTAGSLGSGAVRSVG